MPIVSGGPVGFDVEQRTLAASTTSFLGFRIMGTVPERSTAAPVGWSVST